MKSILRPEETSERDVYKLLIGLVVPRPIGWIGTLSENGIANLAPFSFFNAVCAEPPTVLFSTIRPEGRRKDTLANVEATGEFSVNIVNEDVMEAMNQTSGSYESHVDEFSVAGLTAVPGERIAAPMVAEAPANLECRLSAIIPLGRDDGGATVVFGEVLSFHVEESLLDAGRIDQIELRAVGRMGGPLYVRTGDQFRMDRPQV